MCEWMFRHDGIDVRVNAEIERVEPDGVRLTGGEFPAFPSVFAAGVAVHVHPPEPTPVPCGVPKTGWPTEQMAKTAVKNIVASINGAPRVGDHVPSPREHEFIIPGPEAHWAKLAFEKYLLWSRRHAHA